MKTDKKIEEILNRIDTYPLEDWLTIDKAVKELSTLIDQAVEDGVRGFANFLLLEGGDPANWVWEYVEDYLQTLKDKE